MATFTFFTLKALMVVAAPPIFRFGPTPLSPTGFILISFLRFLIHWIYLYSPKEEKLISAICKRFLHLSFTSFLLDRDPIQDPCSVCGSRVHAGWVAFLCMVYDQCCYCYYFAIRSSEAYRCLTPWGCLTCFTPFASALQHPPVSHRPRTWRALARLFHLWTTSPSSPSPSDSTLLPRQTPSQQDLHLRGIGSCNPRRLNNPG